MQASIMMILGGKKGGKLSQMNHKGHFLSLFQARVDGLILSDTQALTQ